MSLKSILITIIVILSLVMVYQNFANKPSPAITNTEESKSATSNNNKVVSPLNTYDDVRAYMKGLREQPIPEDYEIPDYIKLGLEKDDVYAVFSGRFPMFYGYGSTELLDSIKVHPKKYVEMLTENKAIRRYYDPNSKY